MLAAQMAAVHMALMQSSRSMVDSETLAQHETAERSFNRLTRTFVAQTEGLKRYRSGGEQRVSVQHVTVSEGGQAIVGNVTQGQGAPTASAASPLAVPDAKMVSMPIIESKQPARVKALRAKK